MIQRVVVGTVLWFGILLSGCGFRFANNVSVDSELREIRFESYQNNNFLSREVKNQLRLHGIKIVSSGDVPILRINSVDVSRTTASIFQHGREAESILRLSVNSSVTFPDNKSYPINIENSRTFFNDARAALAKSAEMDLIQKDMERYGAKQIVLQMINIPRPYIDNSERTE